MSDKKTVHRVTLSTGKIVLLRELRIEHNELAMRAVGQKAGDNVLLASTLMQSELLKILIMQVDGKAPSTVQAEKLDQLFTYPEYMQLISVLKKLTGGDVGEPTIAVEISGAK